MEILLCISCLALVVNVCSKRIGEGKELHDPRKFPFYALVFIPIVKDNKGYKGKNCGGSLIHPQWILTAGHCVPDTPLEFDWAVNQNIVMVTMGSVDLPPSKPSQGRKITKIYRHPEFANCKMIHSFGFYSDNVFNDIALLRLNAPFYMSETIQVIQVAKSLPNCKYGIAIGAGITILNKTDSFPKALKYATLPMKKNHELKVPFLNPSGTLTFSESEIGKVYEIEDQGYALQGDSGGPVICAKVNPPILIGVMSFISPRKSTNTVVSAMERVDLFLKFISRYVPEVGYQEQPAKRTRQKTIGAVSNIQTKTQSSLCVLFVLISFVHFA